MLSFILNHKKFSVRIILKKKSIKSLNSEKKNSALTKIGKFLLKALKKHKNKIIHLY